MIRYLIACSLLMIYSSAFSLDAPVRLSVWANEAIISAYTYDSENFLERQKQTAKFFTSKAWVKYSQAQLKSGLIEAVKKNRYRVNAVATLPPKLVDKGLVAGKKTWVVTLPILATYKNPQYQQKQYLSVRLTVVASATKGSRGFAITQFIAKSQPKPSCDNQAATNNSETKVHETFEQTR